ncbi:MAG: hypothetical protein KDA96_21920 [Planctomycetaceae bacterium]|nr:hypothetical protein [Planctomycetaceae bacterium]
MRSQISNPSGTDESGQLGWGIPAQLALAGHRPEKHPDQPRISTDQNAANNAAGVFL